MGNNIEENLNTKEIGDVKSCKKCAPKINDYYKWIYMGISSLFSSHNTFASKNKFECKYCHKESMYNKINIAFRTIYSIIKPLLFPFVFLGVLFLENVTIRILCLCAYFVIFWTLPAIAYLILFNQNKTKK